MSWVAVGVTAAGVVAGKMNSDAQNKKQKDQQMANAAQIQYSPWTHANVSMMGNSAPSEGASMLQGGLAGAMVGSQFNKSAAPSTPTAPTDYSQYSASGMSPDQMQRDAYYNAQFSGKK